MDPGFLLSRDARVFPDEERRLPIRYPYPYLEESTVAIAVPDRWSAEGLPDSVDSTNRFGRYRRGYAVRDGTLRYSRIEEVREPHWEVAEYAAARAWDSACFEGDAEQVLFRR
ncbi:MAG: hypothetical protein GF346_01755 [Candidatus Eisenbacteria bacterium]|nr:hypothetical protein [Candidatus Latescibacterota bacterium]MBD3301156.1 hypothetical protein [Candidatus Eisenbacteria bacterium]